MQAADEIAGGEIPKTWIAQRAGHGRTCGFIIRRHTRRGRWLLICQRQRKGDHEQRRHRQGEKRALPAKALNGDPGQRHH